jgi:hypothetical protein
MNIYVVKQDCLIVLYQVQVYSEHDHKADVNLNNQNNVENDNEY